MTTILADQWAQWVLRGQFNENTQEQKKKIMQEELYPIREVVLGFAAARDGDIVLDVGCGDGLIGFGALKRLV